MKTMNHVFCPHCGTAHGITLKFDDRQANYYLYCSHCGAAGPRGLDQAAAVEKYIQRADSDTDLIMSIKSLQTQINWLNEQCEQQRIKPETN